MNSNEIIVSNSYEVEINSNLIEETKMTNSNTVRTKDSITNDLVNLYRLLARGLIDKKTFKVESNKLHNESFNLTKGV